MLFYQYCLFCRSFMTIRTRFSILLLMILGEYGHDIDNLHPPSLARSSIAFKNRSGSKMINCFVLFNRSNVILFATTVIKYSLTLLKCHQICQIVFQISNNIAKNPQRVLKCPSKIPKILTNCP